MDRLESQSAEETENKGRTEKFYRRGRSASKVYNVSILSKYIAQEMANHQGRLQPLVATSLTHNSLASQHEH